MPTLAEMLTRYLEEKGKTHATFAQEVGINRNTLGKLKRGESQPSVDTFMKLAKFLPLEKVVHAKRTVHVCGPVLGEAPFCREVHELIRRHTFVVAAGLLGVSTSYLNNLRRGDRRPDAALLAKLAAANKVPIPEGRQVAPAPGVQAPAAVVVPAPAAVNTAPVIARKLYALEVRASGLKECPDWTYVASLLEEARNLGVLSEFIEAHKPKETSRAS